MRLLTLLFFVLPIFTFGQSEIIERLKEAAETEFGFNDSRYPDTFLVQNWRTDTSEIYFIVQPYDELISRSEVFAYRRSDSSALNGTIIEQRFSHQYYVESFSQSYQSIASHYKNGKMIRKVSRHYMRYSASYFRDEPQCDGQLYDPIKNDFALIRISGGPFQFTYHDETLSHIVYDGSLYGSLGSNQESLKLFKNGQLKEYNTYDYGEPHQFSTLKLNENGDTIRLENFSDYRRFGLCIERLYIEDTAFYLRTEWVSDSLTDVINSNILFADENDKVVTKEEFCTLVYHPIQSNSTTNTNNWTVRYISEQERKLFNIPYEIILCKKPKQEYFYLQSTNRKVKDDELLAKFLKKNKRRMAALDEN